MFTVRSPMPLAPARRLALLAALASLVLAFLVLATAARATVLDVGNGIYTVSVEDGEGGFAFDCGTWTATTGALHPAGPGENVLYGSGFPGTSDTTVRSYSSGVTRRTGDPFDCESACDTALAKEVEILENDGVPVGVRMRWIFDDFLTTLAFEQLVVVEGPVDGSETVDNTVIRETHVVENAGTGELRIGLRKMWDWKIGSDDGPWFGDCASPTAACDRSINMSADGTGADAPYPPANVINEEPEVSECPGDVMPNDPAGCSGDPLYLVAGTISAASGLSPAPTPPEIYQFNSWGSLIGNCFDAPLVDDAECAFGDTAAAYFYGFSDATAIDVPPGESRSFTQYVVAVTGECPEFFDPCEEAVDPTVRTQGYWKRVCRGDHPEGDDERLDEYAVAIDGVPPFEDVTDAAGACDRLNPDPEDDKCEQAEAQFMALLLNVASDKIRTCNCIDDPDLGMTTVGEVIDTISALLGSPDRTFEDCELAQAVADRINRNVTPVPCPAAETDADADAEGTSRRLLVDRLTPGRLSRVGSLEPAADQAAPGQEAEEPRVRASTLKRDAPHRTLDTSGIRRER